ncbi:MerR family DNA-binding protein [Arthrobacter sp. MMS18-M83]|nr:MerR family DNA-binding protein [Arthrobacter sp. MMS18-M83]
MPPVAHPPRSDGRTDAVPDRRHSFGRDAGQAPCIHVRDLLAKQLSELDARIAELTALQATVHDAAVAADPADCDPERICSYL